jgi:hypothetical protein
MADACLKCSRPLVQPATGRRRVYCSGTCKRLAEHEIRRQQRHLEDLERYAGNLELMGDPFGQVRRAKREVAKAEQRLRELLAGRPVSAPHQGGDG